MAFNEGYNTGLTTGTTAVVMVAAPASGNRIIKTITIHNADTAAATVTVRINTSGSTFRTIIKVTLAVGDTLILDDPIVIPSTAVSLQAILAGAVTTNELQFTAHYGEST